MKVQLKLNAIYTDRIWKCCSESESQVSQHCNGNDRHYIFCVFQRCYAQRQHSLHKNPPPKKLNKPRALEKKRRISFPKGAPS